MAITRNARRGWTSAAAPVAGTNAVQTLTIGGTPTGGTFALARAGLATNAIDWSSNNAVLLAAIQGALQGLNGIGGGNATATAGTLTAGIGTVLLTFIGSLAATVQPTLTVADNSLTGTSPTLAVATTTPGVAVTGVGAAKGVMLADRATGIQYSNTGTASSPSWTKVGLQS